MSRARSATRRRRWRRPRTWQLVPRDAGRDVRLGQGDRAALERAISQIDQAVKQLPLTDIIGWGTPPGMGPREFNPRLERFAREVMMEGVVGEALAHVRMLQRGLGFGQHRLQGLPAVCINWGIWSGTGAAAATENLNIAWRWMRARPGSRRSRHRRALSTWRR